jgi:hypothetical protein
MTKIDIGATIVWFGVDPKGRGHCVEVFQTRKLDA